KRSGEGLPMEPKTLGKQKDVYELKDGKFLMKFKEDVTDEDGVFDLGSNTVGLTKDGLGEASLKLSTHLLKLVQSHSIPTHFIESDIYQATMTVIPATPFGEGLEVICRYRAVGSFLKRYGKYAEEGQHLDAFVEVTLKDDERKDPPISKDALHMLSILSEKEYDVIKKLTVKIAELVKEELTKYGMEL